jgi:hypothetical protein
MLRAICVALVLGLGGASLEAAENFVPKGHLYTPDDPSLPDLNSDADDLNNVTDVYESELFVLKRDRKIFDSQLNRFFSDQELPGGDLSPDY